jgi:hypothetical protein
MVETALVMRRREVEAMGMGRMFIAVKGSI